MNFFVSKAANLFAQNRLLKFIILCLTVGYVFNSLLVNRALKYQKIVLVPPHMTGTIEFVQGKPTETYIHDIGRRVVMLAANYSPATARKQFDELLFYYAPESYPDASRSLYSLAGRVEDAQVSSVFFPESFKLKENHIEIFGNIKQFTGNTFIENRSATYRLEYKIIDGKFEVVSLLEQ
jgi:conjugal transfer pilus assembly protein TraE